MRQTTHKGSNQEINRREQSKLSQLVVLLLIPDLLRHPDHRIQTLQARHLIASVPRNPQWIAKNDLNLHLLARFPVDSHARLAAARVLLCRPNDLIGGRKLLGHGLAEDLGCGLKDLGHDTFEMALQFWVERHNVVREAKGEDRGWVHGGVDGDLVPADELQFGMAVGFGVFDASLPQHLDERVIHQDDAYVAIFSAPGV